jgi:hypothetical protein
MLKKEIKTRIRFSYCKSEFNKTYSIVVPKVREETCARDIYQVKYWRG